MTTVSQSIGEKPVVLSRLRVRTRLYIGFAATILVAILLAGTGIWSIDKLGRQIETLGKVDANVQQILTEQILLESIRREQLRILYDGDQASADEMRTAQAKARAILTGAAANTDAAERQALYQGLSSRLAEQMAGSAELAEVGQRALQARARLTKDGDELTAATDRMITAVQNQHNEAATSMGTMVERTLLRMRIASLRFQVIRDAAGVTEFRQVAEAAVRALNDLDKLTGAAGEAGQTAAATRAAIQPVRTLLETYRAEFEKFSASALAQNTLYWGTQLPLIQGIQTDLAKASDSLGRMAAATVEGARESVSTATTTALIIAVLGLVLGMLVATVIARGIIGPLAGMTTAMGRLAAGDHGVEVPARGNTDEIGDMARAVDVFKQNGIEAARLTAEQAAEQGAREKRAETLTALVRAFEDKAAAMTGSLASAATELQATATSMTSTATQTRDQASSVAAAAEQMSASIQTVSASAEELGASIGEISRQVSQSSDITTRAARDAETTDQIVRELADGARRIGDVVSLISSIAAQTNLLALNATIEAARAGDAGKGFAVVASEVKSLANQTAKATDDIAQQVAQIQTATKRAVEAIDGIVSTIGEVSRIASGIASAVEQQGAATQEIARSVQQTAMGARDVTSTIADVSQAANDAGAAASEVLGASGQLSRQAEELSREVGRFTAGVRAA